MESREREVPWTSVHLPTSKEKSFQKVFLSPLEDPGLGLKDFASNCTHLDSTETPNVVEYLPAPQSRCRRILTCTTCLTTWLHWHSCCMHHTTHHRRGHLSQNTCMHRSPAGRGTCCHRILVYTSLRAGRFASARILVCTTQPSTDCDTYWELGVTWHMFIE